MGVWVDADSSLVIILKYSLGGDVIVQVERNCACVSEWTDGDGGLVSQAM